MARRSPVKSEGAEIWRRRVEGLAASGKSCREYAAELGVNPHTLAGWRWKLRGSPATATATTATTASRPSTTPPARPEARGFVDVTRQVAAALVGEAGVSEIEVGEAVVRVRGAVDPETLARVLGAVGGGRRCS